MVFFRCLVCSCVRNALALVGCSSLRDCVDCADYLAFVLGKANYFLVLWISGSNLRWVSRLAAASSSEGLDELYPVPLDFCDYRIGELKFKSLSWSLSPSRPREALLPTPRPVPLVLIFPSSAIFISQLSPNAFGACFSLENDSFLYEPSKVLGLFSYFLRWAFVAV